MLNLYKSILSWLNSKFASIGNDKLQHYIVGNIIYSLVFVVGLKFLPIILSLIVANFSVFIAAEVKEYLDSKDSEHTSSQLDALATCLGTVPTTLVIVALMLLK